jgi:DNA (cytosine-5)-methyltransferase 1
VERRPVTAYYNEIDPHAAAWLRELIKRGLIAPGDVDERSIEDVLPSDLAGYTQCHFFAGIGGWSLALRLAGWHDDRPAWTGSCPCQPFSAAGKGRGFADERHLWPAWFHLLCQSVPPVVFGEQVAAAADWLALVAGDLEAVGYAFAALPIEAASVGANHRRDRVWFASHPKRDQQPWAQPRGWPPGRMGRFEQPVAWDRHWADALAELRALDDGLPRNVAGCDAARNAIVPQVAATFIRAYCEARDELAEVA